MDLNKSFSGRLGNLETRLKTILEGAKYEKQGFKIRFEAQVKNSLNQSRYADLMISDQSGILKYVQMVKTPVPARESGAKLFLEKFGGARNGVELVPSD